MLMPVVIALLAFRPVKLHTVSGKITGDNGVAISSVRVSVKGTQTAVLTAKDGTYQINVDDKNGILVFSAIGYDTRELPIKGRTVIDVTLSASVNKLSEVVVTAHSKSRKMSVAGAPYATRDMTYNAQIANGYFYHRDDKYDNFNTEGYDHINENKFLKVTDNPLSTFSIDVDAAS